MFLVPAAGMTKKISLRKAPNWWSVRFGHKNTRVKIKHAWDSSNLSMQCRCGVGRSIRLCNTSSIFSQPIALGIVLGKCGAVHGWWMITLLFPSQDPGTLEHFGFGTTSGATRPFPSYKKKKRGVWNYLSNNLKDEHHPKGNRGTLRIKIHSWDTNPNKTYRTTNDSIIFDKQNNNIDRSNCPRRKICCPF